MKESCRMGRFFLFLSISAALCSGCASVHSVHERGVYTVAWFPDLTPLRRFELIGKADTPKNSFVPGEVPVAVVRGYGDFEMDLQVIQRSTGKVILSKGVQPGRGRGAFQPLPLRVPGEYEVRVLRGGKVYDTYRFTVLSAVPAGSP